MKLLCLLLCVYLSILTTLKWLIKDEDFDGITQFDGSTHTDTDEFKVKVKVKVMDLYSTFQTGYALPKALYM